MQTFLPYPSFSESVRCLDVRRLGKQRVECKQLLHAIGVPVGNLKELPRPSSWSRHPAARMWRRFPVALCEYAMAACREWRERGYKDSLLPQFEATWEHIVWLDANGASPNWLGWDSFHASHRSNLLRKNREWYGRFGWIEPADLEYVWPVPKEAAA